MAIGALNFLTPKVLVAGVVSDFRELRIKRGRRAGEFMAAFKLEDATSHVEIVSFPDRRGKSRSSGSPCCWGETPDGRYLFCVYEQLDPMTIILVTAFEVRRRGE